MDQKDEIKARLDIVEVIREYIPFVKQSGSNWKALCPFHNEKTPSFIVSQDKQFWHCFGCSEGGDVFEFIKKIENVDFMESMRILAPKAGVVLKKQDPKLLNQKSRLIDLHQDAAKFFIAHLWQTESGKKALDYLKLRGIKDDTIKEWKIGWAPDSYEALTKHLQKLNYTDSELSQSGLIGKNDQGSTYDRFRRRIMFSLFDTHEQVIAFTGRLLVEAPGQGKYVNSSQTAIYNKSEVLYGLAQAKDEIKQTGKAILVEGQMDVITAHQAGFKNVIATSGTALTEIQLEQVKRYTKEIIFAFDADQAGAKAIMRSSSIAIKLGFKIYILLIPKGEDPDSMIKNNKDNWQQAVKDAPELMQYLFDRTAENFDLATLDGKKKTEETILPFIKIMSDSLDQDFYLKKLSDKIDVSENIMKERLAGLSVSRQVNVDNTVKISEQVVVKISKNNKIIQRLLAWMLIRHDFWPAVIDVILPEMIDSTLEKELYSQLIVYYTENNSNWNKESILFKKISAGVADIEKSRDLLRVLTLLSEDLAQMKIDKEVDSDFNFLLTALQKDFYHTRLQDLQKNLKESELKKDSEQVDNIINEINKLINKISKLN